MLLKNHDPPIMQDGRTILSIEEVTPRKIQNPAHIAPNITLQHIALPPFSPPGAVAPPTAGGLRVPSPPCAPPPPAASPPTPSRDRSTLPIPDGERPPSPPSYVFSGVPPTRAPIVSSPPHLPVTTDGVWIWPPPAPVLHLSSLSYALRADAPTPA